MSQEELKAEISRNALSICNERIKSKSAVAVPSILESIRTQLEWLIEFSEGRRPDERNRLHDIIIGHYATRELDQEDKDLISALHKAQYVAYQTGRGLKIDMSVLENDS